MVESTVYPGATEGVISQVFEDAGFSIGEDLFLAFSPERVDPGNDEWAFEEIPKVVGGVTPNCGERVETLYGQVFENLVPVESATEAEMTKILENTFRNVNIALVNELAKVSHRLGIDLWDAIEAAKTKPYGFMPFYPGPGLGGHCIPVDPQYLSWMARQEGLRTPLVDLADETNRSMSEYVVTRTRELLDEQGLPLSNANVLILGATYKPDVPDIRKSPALDVMYELEGRVSDLSYNDPYIDSLDVPEGESYVSRPLDEEALSREDCVIIVTDHSSYDMEFIVEHAPLVFDTRNATAGIEADNVERL